MKRRSFLAALGAATLGLPRAVEGAQNPEARVRLFLAGDVMLGRGIDQVLPHSVDPTLYEPYVKTARRYVALAEEENGPLDAPVGWDYVWGDALEELRRVRPDARIINLETAITTRDDWWPTKGIHYRMHPGNAPVLTVAEIDVAVLGNNHVLDWGRDGLVETLRVLEGEAIAVVGAGRDAEAARAPARVGTARGRVRIHAWGTSGAGVPGSWTAGAGRPGVNVLPSLDADAGERVIAEIERAGREDERAQRRGRAGEGPERTAPEGERVRRGRDRVVASIHWGPNWGYDVPDEHRRFAHRLIDSGRVDVVFGHSSHHPKAIEVYRGRLILYGAGDFLNDYEGIGGREEYRGDLVLMYFPELAADGALRRLRMSPLQIHRFRLRRPSEEDVAWLAERMDRECRRCGGAVERLDDGRLGLVSS